MKKNMGKADRVVRMVLASVFVLLVVLGFIHGNLAVILLIMAATFAFNAINAFCPLYLPFGFSTRKK
jgi:hypothetical protein